MSDSDSDLFTDIGCWYFIVTIYNWLIDQDLDANAANTANAAVYIEMRPMHHQRHHRAPLLRQRKYVCSEDLLHLPLPAPTPIPVPAPAPAVVLSLQVADPAPLPTPVQPNNSEDHFETDFEIIEIDHFKED